MLGPDHGVTKALAKASTTMDKADLWRARLAVKTLRRDQREAIAEVGERLRRRSRFVTDYVTNSVTKFGPEENSRGQTFV